MIGGIPLRINGEPLWDTMPIVLRMLDTLGIVSHSQDVGDNPAMGLLARDYKRRRRVGVGFRFTSWWALPVIPWLLIVVGPGYGQAPANPIIYTRQPVFRIPFETDAGERRLQEVQLYVSEDRGRRWQKVTSAPPEQHGFNFRAEHDGLYWFRARTVDFAGRGNPATLEGTRPDLEVYVDTQPPVIDLRPVAAHDGMYAVEWDIREENLDLASFVLEYRPPGGSEWIPVTVEPAARGQRSWSPSVSGAIEVRLRVRDLAKNDGERTITLTPSSPELRPSNTFSGQDSGPSSTRTAPGKRFVNSKKISLNYEIKEEGPSGIQAVELWYTRDGRTWEKHSDDTKHLKPPYVFEVQDEGVYGFSLIVRSGVGLTGERPPRSGDPPQVWVEVDITKPVVHWVQADVGRGSDSGWLTITWKATDKNLGRDPISLSYGVTPQGPWTPIASHIENNGRYRWQMPAGGVPYKFFVRVEATDQASNVGALATAKEVIVDLAQPKGLILGVEPASKEAAGSPEHDPSNRER